MLLCSSHVHMHDLFQTKTQAATAPQNGDGTYSTSNQVRTAQARSDWPGVFIRFMIRYEGAKNLRRTSGQFRAETREIKERRLHHTHPCRPKLYAPLLNTPCSRLDRTRRPQGGQAAPGSKKAHTCTYVERRFRPV